MDFRSRLFLLIAIVFLACSPAYGLSLDSVAGWGRFPRFCVNTYHWGDRFFNSYDSAYVKPTGYRMNVKLRTNSWFDCNDFYLGRGNGIEMRSPATSTIGFDVTYMAVSLGYDININKLFGGIDRTKSKFDFSFSCALFTAGFYSIKNDVGMTISRFGSHTDISIPFKGVRTLTWGIDACYYFNHKKYSYSAAFSFSKLQQRSQGSFSLGLSYCNRNLKFDFNQLPEGLEISLPEQWKNSRYEADMMTFGIKGGYGYNWVPAKGLTVGLECSFIPCLAYGKKNSDKSGYSFILNNRANVSVVYNKDRWFFGLVGRSDAGLVYDRHSTLSNSVLSVEMKIGWRFNLWK